MESTPQNWVIGAMFIIISLGPGAALALSQDASAQAAALGVWDGYLTTINIAGQLQAGVYEAVWSNVLNRQAPPAVELNSTYVPAPVAQP